MANVTMTEEEYAKLQGAANKAASGDMNAVQSLKAALEAYAANNQASEASAAARDLAGNYRQVSNGVQDIAGYYGNLARALGSQMNQDPAVAQADLEQRASQIFSALAGGVDRSAAITASQGFSKALKNGMGDSTQAADMAQTTTRQLADVYQRLREQAYQRAFDEQKARQGQSLQGFQAATQGVYGLNNTALTNARQAASDGRAAATTANKGFGARLQDLLESSAGTWAAKQVNGQLDKLTGSIRKGLGFGDEALQDGYSSSDMTANIGNRQSGGSLGYTGPMSEGWDGSGATSSQSSGYSGPMSIEWNGDGATSKSDSPLANISTPSSDDDNKWWQTEYTRDN